MQFYLSLLVHLLNNKTVLLTTLCSVLVDKAGQIEHVGLGELLLHLVELVGTNCVEVSSLQLLLQELGDRNLIQEACHATHVVGDQLLVLIVLEVVWVDL